MSTVLQDFCPSKVCMGLICEWVTSVHRKVANTILFGNQSATGDVFGYSKNLATNTMVSPFSPVHGKTLHRNHRSPVRGISSTKNSHLRRSMIQVKCWSKTSLWSNCQIVHHLLGQQVQTIKLLTFHDMQRQGLLLVPIGGSTPSQ